jgi:FHA domain
MDVRLQVLRGPMAGQSVPLRLGRCLIGREPDCHFRPNSAGVSRHHCELLLGVNTLCIRDLDSRNGTFVNRRRIGAGETILSTGDLVSVGDTVFAVEFTAPRRAEIARRPPRLLRAPHAREARPIEPGSSDSCDVRLVTNRCDSVATGPAGWLIALNGSAARSILISRRQLSAPRPLASRAVQYQAPRIAQSVAQQNAANVPPRMTHSLAPRIGPSSRFVPQYVNPHDSVNWRDALSSVVALKPLAPDEERRERRAKRATDVDEEDQPGPYKLDESSALPPRRSRNSLPVGFLVSSYRGTFRRLGRLMRWVNETAYGLSILFLMLACVGFAMQVYENLDNTPTELPRQSHPVRGLAQIEAELASADLPAQAQSPPDYQQEKTSPESRARVKHKPIKQSRLVTAGIAGIVLLNLLRLVSGAANLVMIVFRRSPIHGALFLIPPLTVVYVWRHWYQLHQPVQRMVTPLLTLGLVVLAYTFVPGLSSVSRSQGSFRHQVEGGISGLKRQVTQEVDRAHKDVRSLELPGKFDQARKAMNDLGQQVKKTTTDLLEPGHDAKTGKKSASEKAPVGASDSSTSTEE